MTIKERFDIRTMRYFIPKSGGRTYITKTDEQAMAALSSRGTQPKQTTRGITSLIWGKTYRDEQITSYKRDVRLGLFTKHELISAMPIDMQDWLADKLKDVPYDEDSNVLLLAGSVNALSQQVI